MKNAKKLLELGENDSRHLSIILIMIAQVLFLGIFFKKDPHLNALRCKRKKTNCLALKNIMSFTIGLVTL